MAVSLVTTAIRFAEAPGARLAGGGVKGGEVIGATDAVGLRAEQDKTHVHDIHATILHLLGLNHKRLTFRHNGRNERLTDNGGELIEAAIT